MPASRPQLKARRRGTVLVMVIAILAMLFVIGTTQLMVARFEKQSAEKKSTAANLKGVASMVYLPVAELFKADTALAAGIDGTDPGGQDFADFTGTAENVQDPNGISLNQATREGLQLGRSGDLLVSSLEPYWDGSQFRYFGISMGVDAATRVQDLPANNAFISRITNGSPNLSNGDGDADGDGTSDARPLTLGLSGMFGGKYQVYQRAIAHGGMITLNRMTHPALLAQGIHPSDSLHSAPMNLFASWTPNTTDEARLRRRFFLPDSTSPSGTDWTKLPSNDLRRLLPNTLGFVSSAFNSRMTPHWWPVRSDDAATGEPAWWNARMRPTKGMTDAGYSASSDSYDRRHLLTTASYDDLLRPQRSEKRLLQMPNPAGSGYVANDVMGKLYFILNPETEGGVFTLGAFQAEKQGRAQLSGPPLAYGMMQNGSTYSLQFNRPGLRTQFSLRDTLVAPGTNLAVDMADNPLAWGYQASARRAYQLTSYYLAMVQHTTVPGSARIFNSAGGSTNPLPAELLEQFKTAVQLALNTIDFADNADVDMDGAELASDIRFDTNGDGTVSTSGAVDMPIDPLTAYSYAGLDASGNPETITLYGYEKQPFVTEAYAKLMHKPINDPKKGWIWDPTVSDESLYAVELYNPYMFPMRLDDFALKIGSNVYADLAGTPGNPIIIPARGYIVLANRPDDVARTNLELTNGTPFIGIASGAGKNLYVAGTDFSMLTWDGANGTTSAAGEFKLIATGVSLVRKSALYVATKTDGTPVTRLVTATAANRLGARVEVDLLCPSNLGNNGNNLAKDDRFCKDADLTARSPSQWDKPAGGKTTEDLDRLVSDSSLQRDKTGIEWHFTICRQMVFPVPWYEHPENLNSTTNAPWVSTRPDSPPQHNLLATALFVGPDGLANQAIIARYMKNMQLDLAMSVTPTKPYPDGRTVTISKSGTSDIIPLTSYGEVPVAPVQLLTSDLGLDAYGRCRAFPNTATLLLVSRLGHMTELASGATEPTFTPVSVALTKQPFITDKNVTTYASLLSTRTGDDQMLQVDNGHLPVFDRAQVALNDPRRLDMPWGQLVFDYFTALPLEELFQVKNLTALNLGSAVRPIDLYDEQNTVAFDNAYKFIVNNLGANAYGSLPTQDGVAVEGIRTVGPRVRGRVNLNMAPWWVLDGLPALPDQYLDPTNANYGLLNTLPVPELLAADLDPAAYAVKPAGSLTYNLLMDYDTAKNAGATAGFPTLSPTFARYIVSYREKREVESPTTVAPLMYWTIDTAYPRNPGLAGTGTLCDIPWRIPMSLSWNTVPLPATTTLMNLRWQRDPANVTPYADKPFSYVGYLQLVAPIARILDWETVKSHVYTLYNVVGDTSEPPIWLRSQTTLDRTRCLYSNDLPERIVQTEPISYSNATSDQP